MHLSNWFSSHRVVVDYCELRNKPSGSMKSGVHLTSQMVCGFSTVTLLPRFEYLVLQET